MRIIRFLDDENREHYGLESKGESAEVLQGDLYAGLSPSGTTAPIAGLLAPIDPVNIYCIGLNYREHAAESGMEEFKLPIVFANLRLCHPEDPIRLPACQQDEEVDYECELAAIIGRPVRDVAVEDALDSVLGYTCANDVSARKWQLNAGGGQWIRGKGFDTFCPLGPVLVTADEIADPQSLGIKTILNGQTMQITRREI